MTIKFQIGIDPELLSILRTLAAAAGGLGINAVQIEAEGALMIQQLQTLTDQVPPPSLGAPRAARRPKGAQSGASRPPGPARRTGGNGGPLTAR